MMISREISPWAWYLTRKRVTEADELLQPRVSLSSLLARCSLRLCLGFFRVENYRSRLCVDFCVVSDFFLCFLEKREMKEDEKANERSSKFKFLTLAGKNHRHFMRQLSRTSMWNISGTVAFIDAIGSAFCCTCSVDLDSEWEAICSFVQLRSIVQSKLMESQVIQRKTHANGCWNH